MAPSRTAKKSNKTSGKKLGATKDSKTRVSKSSSTSKTSVKRPSPKEQKSQRPVTGPSAKKRRVYTEKELGIPQLNMVTPIGVQKPRGKKKGKVFVDDPHSMMTIMAMVNAEKEGQIESKMLRARQLEEIRQLKHQEQEQREAERKERLEQTKDSLRKKRRRTAKAAAGAEEGSMPVAETRQDGKKKKKVSFG